MEYAEYGKENQNVILLLHGGGLSWWNYRDAAQRLSSHYRVILPILDGHGGSDRDFTTIEENADRIIAFIDQHFSGKVLLLGGLSLGGQIALEILARRKDICAYALIESALVVPSRLTHALVRPAFGSCYGLVKRRWFSRLQFQFLGLPPALFEEYYRDTCAISKENMIAFLQANAQYDISPGLGGSPAITYIFVGKKERAVMKRSARKLSGAMANARVRVLDKMGHGDFSINHPELFAAAVKEITMQP